MISIEEKMRVFSQYLINKERSWGKEIIDDAKNKRKELFDNSDKLVKNEKKAIEERSYRQIYRDKNKIIAEGKNKAKNLELAQKKLMLAEFNDLVLEQAEKIVSGDLYENYLRRSMDEINTIFVNKKQLVITANLEDMELIKDLANKKLSAYEIKYRENPKDGFIRGMIVEDINGLIQSDFTMKSTIRANYKLIGMTLNRFMKKQVK